MIEETLERVGLPVTCKGCGMKGRVKPRTDYGGWFKWKRLRARSIWYCPTDGEIWRERLKQMDITYRTPEVKEELSVEDELYKLLD